MSDPQPVKRPARGLWSRTKRTLRLLVTMRGTPEAIAGGVALGTFLAFSPTVGFQMILAAFFATVFRLNRPAAILPVWITNPVTIPPLFYLTYWVGCTFWPGPAASDVYDNLVDFCAKLASFDFWDMSEQFTAMLDMGWNILMPLVIGGVLVGGVAAGVAYLVTVRLIRRARTLIQRRRAHRKNQRGTADAPA